MYAVVEMKGKQYKVWEGGLLKVDLLDKQSGETVEFDTVRLLYGDDSPIIGEPYIQGAKVIATVGTTIKGSKVKVVKFKRRKGYHRTQGHRQKYTLIKVNQIISP